MSWIFCNAMRSPVPVYLWGDSASGKTHLLKGELPAGRLVVAVSKHYTAVIDGVIHDTHDPTRAMIWYEAGKPPRMTHRCVYGYWTLKGSTT